MFDGAVLVRGLGPGRDDDDVACGALLAESTWVKLLGKAVPPPRAPPLEFLLCALRRGR